MSRRAEASAKATEFQRKFGIRVERVEDESARFGGIKDFCGAKSLRNSVGVETCC